ncbi:MAG TPA: hypothetical protein VF680_16895 [Allosphingosinicella sp.]|jgi:hypothetical protein
MNNIKTANLNVRIKNFFMRYIEFLQPFHKLRKQEQTLLALLLYHHYRLKKEITNNKILWKEVFDYDTRVLICEEMGIVGQTLENLLTRLRKQKVIIDKQVSNLYIPEMSNDTKQFTITFNFNIIYEEN